MKLYAVEMYDDLFEGSMLYPRAYLTREAAQKRADRMTHEDEGVRYWAEVCEVEFIGMELQAENERLRKELEMEREDNLSIRALFDAVAPRCGKPDCPSLVVYVDKLREMVRDMWRAAMANMDFADRYAFAGEFNERMRELGVEVVE